jgi:hypothetical protein
MADYFLNDRIPVLLMHFDIPDVEHEPMLASRLVSAQSASLHFKTGKIIVQIKPKQASIRLFMIEHTLHSKISQRHQFCL